MKVGDLVNVTEMRGTGSRWNDEIPLGVGLVLDVKETEDVTFGSVGPVNLGKNVTVQLCSSGEIRLFVDRSLEVISEGT